jgi:hypothetical protein
MNLEELEFGVKMERDEQSEREKEQQREKEKGASV